MYCTKLTIYIYRAALGEGHAHPWQTNYEEDTDIDDEDVFNSGSGTSSSRPRVRRSVEAFNAVVISDNETGKVNYTE